MCDVLCWKVNCDFMFDVEGMMNVKIVVVLEVCGYKFELVVDLYMDFGFG